jgi:hypothetical protein
MKLQVILQCYSTVLCLALFSMYIVKYLFPSALSPNLLMFKEPMNRFLGSLQESIPWLLKRLQILALVNVVSARSGEIQYTAEVSAI